MIYIKQSNECERSCVEHDYSAVILELQRRIAELDLKILQEEISLGRYNIPPGSNANINVRYIPKDGYNVIGFSVNYPSRYAGGLRYTNDSFNGSIFNLSNNSGSYEVSVLILLGKM